MKKYLSLFRIRFIHGLQYRAAAWAGVSTQFAWGSMTILMFWAFYQNSGNRFPMTFHQLSTYIWLQQAFLSLFMSWYFDNDIFESIIRGHVAYELCRPVDIYTMWFLKNMSVRLSRAVLRCMPILIAAVFLPKPFSVSPPADLTGALMFFVSISLGFLLMVAFSMLIYITAFTTISPLGIRILAVSTLEFFTGAIIPLPFFPEGLQKIMAILPFAYMQSTPFLIYIGSIMGPDILIGVLLQMIWLLMLILTGRTLMKKALKKVVIQGG
ncbi:MAG: ABC transporter permease [Clostridiales bacterium]|nr:ABC transporter permease [Clostridiales bacterium]